MQPTAPRRIKKDAHLPHRTIFAALLILIAIPLVIFLGIVVWDDRKYYIVSLMIIFLSMLPFAFKFENRKPQAREIVILSVMVAIGVAGRAAFYMLPQFKPVVAIVIITAVAFGGEAGFITGASIGFISNFFFGQGPWTPWQMFGFGIIGFLAGVLFSKGILKAKPLPLCIYGGLSTLIIYGLLLDSASLFMFSSTITWQALLAMFSTGLVFNIIHAAATVIFLFLLSGPLLQKLERVKKKFGIMES